VTTEPEDVMPERRKAGEELPEWLVLAAEHFEHDPRYVAHAMAVYRRRSGRTMAELANELGCDESTVLRLAVRPRPDTAALTYPGEVWDLAASVGCDAFALSALLAAAGGEGNGPSGEAAA
jgi:hypothetical protein